MDVYNGIVNIGSSIYVVLINLTKIIVCNKIEGYIKYMKYK